MTLSHRPPMRPFLRSLGRDASAEERLAAVHAVARVTLAVVFLWHGLVPKLLYQHPDELALLRDAGLSAAAAVRTVRIVGVAEVVYGLALLIAWRARMLFLLGRARWW